MTIEERKNAFKHFLDNRKEDADEGIFISFIDELQQDLDEYENLKTDKTTLQDTEFETLKEEHETLKSNHTELNNKYNNLKETYKRRFFGVTDVAIDQNAEGLEENEEPDLTYENLLKRKDD